MNNCLNCSKSTANNKYCTIFCQKDFQAKALISRWLIGDWEGASSQGASKLVRKYLMKEANNKCVKCGWGEINPTTGKVPLEVNHIDGDSTNNRPENLEILCPNCHSLTSNYRALNKNSKRGYRRK